MHLRKAMDPKDKTILRANFDTLYSMAVVGDYDMLNVVLVVVNMALLVAVVAAVAMAVYIAHHRTFCYD